MSEQAQPHALYRFLDNAGQLLYVGITADLGSRLKQHGRDKPWWQDVAQVTVEHFNSRSEVLAAERAAIVAEKPKHNIVHNGPGARPSGPGQPQIVQTRLAPFQVDDWVALCLTDGACIVGGIEAFDDTWVSVRLKDFMFGWLSDRIVTRRWADVEYAESAYPEDAEDAEGRAVLNDEHLGRLQTWWIDAHPVSVYRQRKKNVAQAQSDTPSTFVGLQSPKR